MEALFNALIAVALLVLLVLTIYLVDRVNNLERETRRVTEQMNTPPPKVEDVDPFNGLSGKKLWEQVTRKDAKGAKAEQIQALRQAYRDLLWAHVGALFEDGVREAGKAAAEPRNPMTLALGARSVESWLPPPQVKTIYQCGQNKVAKPGEDGQTEVRLVLRKAVELLMARVEMDGAEDLVNQLMPVTVSNPTPAATGPGAATPAAMPAA